MSKFNKRTKIFFTTFSLCLISLTILYFPFKKQLPAEPKAPYLTIFGRVLMADGIGRQSAELIDALKNDLSIGFKKSGPLILEETPLGIRDIFKEPKPLGQVLVYQDYLVVNGKPLNGNINDFKNAERIRIAQSMFESTMIPAEWVVILNHYFDAVFVPDKFLIDVYKNSGVVIPIFELPLAINLDKFYKFPLKVKRNTPMVFANLSTAISRKNQLKLVQAFHQAFGNSPDVKLRLNSRECEPAYSQAIKNAIHQLKATTIEFTEMSLEEELYFKLFQDIDCYVSLSLGEGFSIQPREAMALGIPTIVTDNTGQATICASNLVRRIPSLEAAPAFYPLYNNYYGESYDCTTTDCVEALRDVYENYATYLQKGASARAWVQQYSYDHLKPLYLGLIQPKKIVLGDVNKITPECLFTNSKELCEKFNKLLGTPFEAEQ